MISITFQGPRYDTGRVRSHFHMQIFSPGSQFVPRARLTEPAKDMNMQVNQRGENKDAIANLEADDAGILGSWYARAGLEKADGKSGFDHFLPLPPIYLGHRGLISRWLLSCMAG